MKGRLYTLLAAVVWPSLVKASSPPVQVSFEDVMSRETLAIESPDDFFPFIDLLSNPEILPSTDLAPDALHQAALKPGSLGNVEMHLALHSATPKIEAFYSYYANYVNKTVGCGSWVDWYGEIVCDVENLKRLAGTETIGAGPFTRPQTLTFDHIYPPAEKLVERPPRTAILYASPSSSNLRALHAYLYKLAGEGDARVEYVLRHVPPPTRNPPNTLSGYGVALDLKKMDYLALDDRFSNQNKKQAVDGQAESQLQDPIVTLMETYAENATAPDASVALTLEELAGLGPQAVQLIADSEQPLETFIRLSQDFPKYAASLARRVVANESVVEELRENAVKARGGVNMLWLNGKPVEAHDVEPLPMLRILKKERTLMLQLTDLGLTRDQAYKLLTHTNVAASQREKSSMDALYDASDREEGGDLIVYWNDLEKDARYSRWSPTLHALIQDPMYPGQFPNVKANFINLIAGPISNIIERNLPFTFGVIPIIETEDGKKMARLFYHLIKTYGRKKTISFLHTLSDLTLPPQLETIPTVRWFTVQEAYNELVASSEGITPTPFEEVLKTPLELEEKLLKMGHAFFNGKHYPYNANFLSHLQNDAMEHQQYYMEQVYRGLLTDEILKEKGLGNHFYDLPTTNKQRNRYIFPKNRTDLKMLNIPEVLDKAGLTFDSKSYLYPTNDDSVVFTVYVVGDFDCRGEALQALESDKTQMRVSFVPNPEEWDAVKPGSTNGLLSKLVTHQLLEEATPTKDSGEFTPAELRRYLKSSRIFAREAGIKPGESAVVINGRVVGPFQPNDFRAVDFATLEDFEVRKRTGPVVGALRGVAPFLVDDKFRILAKWDCLTLPTGLAGVTTELMGSNYTYAVFLMIPWALVFTLHYSAFEYGDPEEALYHVIVLVDPLSTTGQKWASMVQWLSVVPNVFIKVLLNPDTYKQEVLNPHPAQMPIKQFYRYNLPPVLSFDTEGHEIPSQIDFEGLPIDPIYTLAMDVPASWLVRPKESRYDLDNIQLGQLFPGDEALQAIFSLDALLVEGHAREVPGQQPPRGVQLQIVTKGTPKQSGTTSVPLQDTLVVANLGYFQFRLTPGVFGLEIREGVGRKVYNMESVGAVGWESPTVEEVGDQVALVDFEGVTLFPRLKRKPGMEEVDVLAEAKEEDKGGLFESISSKVKSLFGGKKAEETGLIPVKKEQAEINIFTVASGLLYERFASIMILSVLKNTNHTVKFWFIENFLSPSFLEFIPHMAAEYKFDYELVTYRWPSWLRAQTEKQRIIWAVQDSIPRRPLPYGPEENQIVRADLKELVDLDLQGAPYGYTPMGDDNKEMEGLSVLEDWVLEGILGRNAVSYQMAAGDILRGQYQGLSADPNSLANLDQDLPNNLQRQVPIFSLNEDWLWCESWCSKDRLHRAKTIDLCQNPMTALTSLQKEPKLSRARQIPEWEEYDAEIARLTRKLADEGKISTGLATADANVLAGGGTPAIPEMSQKEEEDLPLELADTETEELLAEIEAEESARVVDEL
ncbi:UDP-glucose:glycoprotein glucosyltransferase-domain-containing protein [Coprinopsis sp. MPI-PUGE-AT-0042]|nr:UDP-glucose:glycoprotein glucosyltransferase-domain-containing protein [Coprinopsis sp. MPI-PUGE-AT-0042]